MNLYGHQENATKSQIILAFENRTGNEKEKTGRKANFKKTELKAINQR